MVHIQKKIFKRIITFPLFLFLPPYPSPLGVKFFHERGWGSERAIRLCHPFSPSGTWVQKTNQQWGKEMP